jgi:hypothetical protein
MTTHAATNTTTYPTSGLRYFNDFHAQHRRQPRRHSLEARIAEARNRHPAGKGRKATP